MNVAVARGGCYRRSYGDVGAGTALREAPRWVAQETGGHRPGFDRYLPAWVTLLSGTDRSLA